MSAPLTELVYAELEAHPSLSHREIADRIAGKLSQTQVDELIARHLVEIVTNAADRARQKIRRNAGPSRWSLTSRLEERIVISPGYSKLLRECTADDLRTVVANYDRRIAELESQRTFYAQGLEELERSGAETVGAMAENLVAA